VCGGAAAFKMSKFLNIFKNLLILKVQANFIRLPVKCKALHPPPFQHLSSLIKLFYNFHIRKVKINSNLYVRLELFNH